MTAPNRRYDLDRLRIFAVGVVFFYHLARFFDPPWWHIKNAQTYPLAGLARLLVGEWMMPLLFLVSGAGVYFALRSRTGRAFINERAARLLVPFAVGVVTHVALQVYLERRATGDFEGSFLAFYPHYYDGVYGFGGAFAWMGLHLWFLPALFLFSVLFLPLFQWLRGDGAGALDRMTGFLARPGLALLMAVPVVVLLVWLDPAGLAGNRDAGGWSVLIYPVFFVYGFVFVASPALEAGIRRARWGYATLAGGLSLWVIVLWVGGGEPAFDAPGFARFAALYGINAWCWLLAIWGFGTLHLNKPASWLRYANDAVLPFYVLHQSVMLLVGYFVVQWPLPDALKFILIGLLAFVLTLILYHFVIRRYAFMRVLFGLRARIPPVVG